MSPAATGTPPMSVSRVDDAPHVRRRRGESQYLLGEVDNERGFDRSSACWSGLRISQQHAFGDAVSRRFVAGDQQLLQDRQHLRYVERPLVLEAGVHDVRDDVVAALAPAFLELVREVVLEVDDAVDGGQFLVGRRHPRKLRDEGIRPGLEQIVIRERDAELIGDHRHGHAFGERLHELAASLVDESVDQVVAELFDPGLEGCDAAGGERFVHHSSITAMQRRVLGQHGIHRRVPSGRGFGDPGSTWPSVRMA
jgi:hypothetical protein